VPLTQGIASGALDFSKLSQSLKGAGNPFQVLQPKGGLSVNGTRAGNADWPAIQADLKAILIPALDLAIGYLTIAESDPAFTFRLGTGWYYMSSGYTQYTVHVGDVYVFDGLVRAIKAEVLMACAYSVDAGSFDFGASAAALDVNQDGILTPSEYLPPSPFLTFIDAGSMADAKTALEDACDKATHGLDLAIAEGNPNDWQNYDVIDWMLITREDLIGLRSVIAQVKQSLAAPVTLPVPNDAGTANIQIYLGAWFASPPADLKALAPNFAINADGSRKLIPTSFPDPTFGGLIPGGMPNYLLGR
jgi:hypothetical protein